MEENRGIAERVEPENITEFVDGLNRLLTEDTGVCNTVAREYAVNHLGKDLVLSKFYQDLRELCGLSYDSNIVREDLERNC